MNTAIAIRRPSGSAIKPMSLVARVSPLRVASVPVLCATIVPAGSNPFSRFAPGVDAIMSSSTIWRDSGESVRPVDSDVSRATAAAGVESFRYCTVSSRDIAASLAATVMSRMPRPRR